MGEEQGDSARAAIRALFEGLPNGYAERYTALQHVRQTFHEELARALQTSLRAFVSARMGDPGADPRECVTFINEQTRLLGLCLRCPRSAMPAVLVADSQDAAHPDKIRFRFVVRDERNRARRTVTSATLPDIELMPDPPRVESFSRSFRPGPGGPSR